MEDLGLAKYFLEKGLLGAICVVLGIALYQTYKELRENREKFDQETKRLQDEYQKELREIREVADKVKQDATQDVQRLNKEHRDEIRAINDWAYRELSELHESRSGESKELAQKLFDTVMRMKEAMDLVSNLAETSIRGSNDKEKADVRKVSRNRGSV